MDVISARPRRKPSVDLRSTTRRVGRGLPSCGRCRPGRGSLLSPVVDGPSCGRVTPLLLVMLLLLLLKFDVAAYEFDWTSSTSLTLSIGRRLSTRIRLRRSRQSRVGCRPDSPSLMSMLVSWNSRRVIAIFATPGTAPHMRPSSFRHRNIGWQRHALVQLL